MRALAVMGTAILVVLPAVSAGAATIAVLKSKNIKIYNEAIVGFKTACAGDYHEFDLNEDLDRGKPLSKEINALSPDVVFVLGARAAISAKRYIDDDMPVVFSLVLNPERNNIAADNITGIKMEIPLRTQLETLKAIVPDVDKIGVMYNPKKSQDLVRRAAELAKDLGIQLVASRIEEKQDAVRGLTAFAGGIDAFWLIPDPTVANKTAFPHLLRFTAENRIPFFAFSEAFVRARALFSLSPAYAEIGGQACELAQQIIAGESPSDIPWQDPGGLKLSVNLKTAETLGLNDISMNAFSYAAQENYEIQPVK